MFLNERYQGPETHRRQIREGAELLRRYVFLNVGSRGYFSYQAYGGGKVLIKWEWGEGVTPW